MEIMKSVEVGTKVKIGNSGGTYSMYGEFFDVAGVPELLGSYDEGNAPENGVIATVVAVAKHPELDRDICIVDIVGKAYIIEISSLVTEDTELTEEIINKLEDYGVKIAEDDFNKQMESDPFLQFLAMMMAERKGK